jgi:hypothetical protein
MNVFDPLSKNKGTTSSALSKTLAQNILNGQTSLLLDCIDLVSYNLEALDQKHIRAGASKVVEIVSLNRPDLVAPHLQKLLPALSVGEPQTRWMIIRTMGFCAPLNKPVAEKAIAYAEKFIKHKEGLSLASSTDLFLGDFGAIGKDNAQKAFPLLEESMKNLIANEQDWLLEALFRMFQNLDAKQQALCFEFARSWQNTPRKSTRQRVRMILRLKE